MVPTTKRRPLLTDQSYCVVGTLSPATFVSCLSFYVSLPLSLSVRVCLPPTPTRDGRRPGCHAEGVPCMRSQTGWNMPQSSFSPLLRSSL
ncbi:hypothetical protein BDV32DRAFT_120385 [Aspergillus pseudonomiae]|nr:hypothetical protein BDV32DRAFT_120385 [Aspergillus pseudonomiae]